MIPNLINRDMFSFRLRYLINARGITNPYTFLVKAGFSPAVATRILNNKVDNLKFSHAKLLCKHLCCTPNDLLAYDPAGDILPENHPLLTLVRHDEPFNLMGKLNRLSIGQIMELEQIVSKMQASSGSNG